MIESRITPNVDVSEAAKRRIVHEEKSWTGPKMVALIVVTLAIAFTLLYLMASSTADVPYDDPVVPQAFPPSL